MTNAAFLRIALGIALACAMLAPSAWAYRQQVVLCPQGDGFRVLDIGLHPDAPHRGCEPFDPKALREQAAQGKALALEKLLAVMEELRILPLARVRAAKALDWPKGKRPPQAVLRRLERLFAMRRTPFRAAVAIGEFLARFEPLPAVPKALWGGLQWRLMKVETCPIAAELLSHTDSPQQSRRLMIQAWVTGKKSDGVTACIEREIGPHVGEMLDVLQRAAHQAQDAPTRMRLINWMALAGAKAREKIAAFVDDPDARVRRLARGYLAGGL